MSGKRVSVMMLTLLLIGMLTSAFEIQPVKAGGTIYIRADGSVEPPTANITSADNVTYYFTGNNYDEVVVERSNILVDGDGYTLQGTGSGYGFYLSSVNNVTIQNTNIKSFNHGVRLYSSSNNTMSGNKITNNTGYCVWLSQSSNNNTVSGNNITNNNRGIGLSQSSNNTVSGNTITNSTYKGVYLYSSSNNTVSGNNITNSDLGIYIYAWSSYNTVSGNKITNNTGYGVSLSQASNNTVSGNNITNNNDDGVSLYLSSYNTVSGNNITNNNGYGVWLSSSSSYNTVSGNTITNNAGIGLFSSSNNNTVYGNNITNSSFGVVLSSSSYNTVSGNTITNNSYEGIYLVSSSYNTVSGNDITNSTLGVYLYSSSNNTVSGNNITNNEYGIWFHESSNNMLRDNSMANNEYNFRVWSSSLSHFVNDVDTSNTVDDKPIYYWINMRDVAVPLDAGYVALVNCTSITVQNLNLTNNYQGILLAYTTNSAITNNDITNNGNGIELYESSNNSISGNTITNNWCGVYLGSSSNNTVSGNNITNSYEGAHLYLSSNNNTVYGNTITNNDQGVVLSSSSYNTVYGNTITNNTSYGVWLSQASNNIIYHNNFINNTQQVRIIGKGSNVWDDGYPSGGNYWSNYTGVDLYSGPYQNETGSDGIGDAPHILDADNQDNYPLMIPWPPHQIFQTSVLGHPVIIESNATITFDIVTRNFLLFWVSGPTGATGYINVTFPVGLNTTAIRVFVDWVRIRPPPFPVITTNSTHYFIYFEFTLSTHEIAIQYAIADIAVTNVTPSKTVVGQGYSMSINVAIENQGDFTETFNITAYANTTVIDTLTNITLTSGNSTTLTIPWNTTGTPKGNYTIKAEAAPVPGETDTTDNNLTDGIVLITVPGDVNGDCICDMADISMMIDAFMTYPSDPRWNANCDVNCDDVVDMADISIAIDNFMETC